MKTAPGGNPWTERCGDKTEGTSEIRSKRRKVFRIIDAFLDSRYGRMSQNPGSEVQNPEVLIKIQEKNRRPYLEKSKII